MLLFFLTCLGLGAAAVVVQLLTGVADVETHHDVGHGASDLLSVRALSAGMAFFGLVGLAVIRAGLGAAAALPAALVAGAAATVGVAAVMRSMRRLESDKTFDIHRAVGATGTVHLGIPGNRGGTGKVHVVVREQFMELDAVTAGPELPTGSEILVTDVASVDIVVVAHATPLLREISHVG
jgi:hypothetical protein